LYDQTKKKKWGLEERKGGSPQRKTSKGKYPTTSEGGFWNTSSKGASPTRRKHQIERQWNENDACRGAGGEKWLNKFTVRKGGDKKS